MTNLEYILASPKETKEEIVTMLCDLFQKDCDTCPATKFCFIDHTGFNDWLEQKVCWSSEDEEEREDDEED